MHFINYRIFSSISYSNIASYPFSMLSVFGTPNIHVLDSFILFFTSSNFLSYIFPFFFSVYAAFWFPQVCLWVHLLFSSFSCNGLFNSSIGSFLFVCFMTSFFISIIVIGSLKKSVFLSVLILSYVFHFFFHVSSHLDNYFVITSWYLYYLIFWEQLCCLFYLLTWLIVDFLFIVLVGIWLHCELQK